MTTPVPHDFELKADYLDRCQGSSAMHRLYPTPVKRRLAGERRWAKAKQDSLVSISTSKGEVLLFGKLD